MGKGRTVEDLKKAQPLTSWKVFPDVNIQMQKSIKFWGSDTAVFFRPW